MHVVSNWWHRKCLNSRRKVACLSELLSRGQVSGRNLLVQLTCIVTVELSGVFRWQGDLNTATCSRTQLALPVTRHGVIHKSLLFGARRWAALIFTCIRLNFVSLSWACAAC